MISYIRYVWVSGGFKLWLFFNIACLILISIWIGFDGWQGSVIRDTQFLAINLGMGWLAIIIVNYISWRRYKRMN